MKLDACFLRVLTPCISGLIASNKGARINTLDKDEELTKIIPSHGKRKNKAKGEMARGGGGTYKMLLAY